MFTRKTFVSTLGGALAAGFAHPTEPRQDVITQAELQTVLELENRKTAAILALRGRLTAGAAVEQGPLTAELGFRDGDTNPLPVRCINDEADNFGVYVCQTEWSAEAARSADPPVAFYGFRCPARVSLSGARC